MGCLLRIKTPIRWSVAKDGQAKNDVGDQGGHGEQNGSRLSAWQEQVFEW